MKEKRETFGREYKLEALRLMEEGESFEQGVIFSEPGF